MGRRNVVLAVLVVGLSACAGVPRGTSAPPSGAPTPAARPTVAAEPAHSTEADPPPTPRRGPLDVAARLRPDLLQVEPADVAPGSVLELRFPQETERGNPWALEERIGQTWEVRYLLISAEPDAPGVQPTWTRIEDSSGWEDVGLAGPGPDRVVVPEIATPGRYRLCTANAAENFCAELEVTSGPT